MDGLTTLVAGRAALATTVLDHILGTPARGVVLVGPAGQGKTSVLRHVAAEATRRQVPTASVVATAAAAQAPLGPLAPLLPTSTDRPATLAELAGRAGRAIAARGHGRPPVLTVDDAHLLDATSAGLVHQLAVTGQVVPLIALRADVPGHDALVALWKDGVAHRLDLTPMDEADMAELAADILGGAVSARTSRTLIEASRGNPLVATELIRGSLRTGALEADGHSWRFNRPPDASSRLHELAGARLARLDPDRATAVDLVVVGEEPPLALLRTLVPDDVLADLERDGLLQVDDTDDRPVRIGHPLHHEVLRPRLPVARRVALSRALAQASDRGTVAVDPVRLATWHLDGGLPPDPDLLLTAAHLAWCRWDDRRAETLAAAAFDAGAGTEAVLVRMRALGALGRHEEVIALAAEAAEAPCTDLQRIGLARGEAFAHCWGLGRSEAGIAALRRAEDHLLDPVLADELRAERSLLMLLGGDVDAALTVAVPLLDRSDPRATVVASIVAAMGLAFTGRPTRALAVVGQVADPGHPPGADRDVPAIHAAVAAWARVELGQAKEALARARQGHSEAVAQASLSAQAWWALVAGHAATLLGRHREAVDWYEEATDTFDDLGEAASRRWALVGRVLAGAATRDDEGTDHALAALDALPPGAMGVLEAEDHRARAWHAHRNGDRAAARAELKHAIASADRTGLVPVALAAIHDLARLGATNEARQALAERAIPEPGTTTAIRQAQVEAMAVGDGPGLEAVARRWEQVGAVLFAAEAHAAASAANRRRGDHAAATRAAARAEMLRSRTDAAATPLLQEASTVGALTAREREIAELAARALTAQVIATRLSLSPRTVENHLQRAYTKLGVHNRAELAAALEVDPRPDPSHQS